MVQNVVFGRHGFYRQNVPCCRESRAVFNAIEVVSQLSSNLQVIFIDRKLKKAWKPTWASVHCCHEHGKPKFGWCAFAVGNLQHSFAQSNSFKTARACNASLLHCNAVMPLLSQARACAFSRSRCRLSLWPLPLRMPIWMPGAYGRPRMLAMCLLSSVPIFLFNALFA